MPWTVPDKGEGLHDHQSILFQEYLDVLVAGLSGADEVTSGCAVTAQGSPDMTCAVAAGIVVSNGAHFAVTAGNVTITTADATNPRFDLVVVNSAGTKAVRAGTPAANPKPPARTANDVVLAVVYVPANDTQIASNQIVDLRTINDQGDAPSIISVGAEFTSTGVPTATLPGTHVLNDILVLAIQTSNQNHDAPTGYTQMGPKNGIGTAVAAGATKLCLFWKRDNGAESAPTLTDSGDHTYGFMFAVRGCPVTGDPFRMIGQAWKLTATTTGTADAGTTRRNNCLVVNIFAHAIDSATAQGSSPTNADLASVTEHFDDATTDGTGGGLYLMSGVKLTAGAVTGSTVTWAASTVDVSTTVAFVPRTGGEVFRGPETMTFIGSVADLDDNFVRPEGARRVFAQIVDGGGGGSGGNTTTTAAGGGGGGGGGYDEAWFEAEDLAAVTTVHAGRGGAAGTALNQAGNVGVLSEFNKGGHGPLTALMRITGIAATAAASADGGNGGSGSGEGTTSPAVQTTRLDAFGTNAARPTKQQGGAGGSGTTAPVGGGNAADGGGGGESGADTDAAITAINNGWSRRGAGGGSGGRTNTNISQPGHGGGAASTFGAQGAVGAASTRLPYGGAGGVGGGSSVVTGGKGGFPGGGGGGGAGVAGGFGGAGGDGIVMVTTHF